MDTPLHDRLKEHKTYFEKHVAELRDFTDRAIMKHRRELADRQFVLERLANMAIELFATACVLARTQALLDERGENGCTQELALCDLFCVDAGRRFRGHRLALDAREDEVDDRRRAIAAHLREAGGYPVPDALLDVPADDHGEERGREAAGDGAKDATVGQGGGSTR